MARARPERLSVDEAFGRVLRTVRTERGMSQETLGHESESGRTYVSELERGIKGPSLNMVFRLATALGMKAPDLIGRVERLVSLKRST